MAAQKGNGPDAANDRPAKTLKKDAADFKAAGVHQASATARFPAKPCHGIDRPQYRAAKGCDRILPGAIHTTKQAANIPDSDVFSRSEFEDGLSFQGIHGYGAGSAYPQGRQRNLFCVDIPSSTLRPIQPDGGLSVQQGTETMTTVNTSPTPAPGNMGITPGKPQPIARQQAIKEALNVALYYLDSTSDQRTWLATAHARRALTLLKQACSELQNGGAA